jgi:hypothetical protein
VCTKVIKIPPFVPSKNERTNYDKKVFNDKKLVQLNKVIETVFQYSKVTNDGCCICQNCEIMFQLKNAIKLFLKTENGFLIETELAKF